MASGLVVLGLGVTYWLVARHEDRVSRHSLIEGMAERQSAPGDKDATAAPAAIRATTVKESA